MKPVQSSIPPRGFYYSVSDRLYAAIQRAVAFTLMTNQRYCYSRYKELNMDNRRVAILKSDEALLASRKARMPRVIPVEVPSDEGITLQGILLAQEGCLEVEDGIPKITGRLLVAYSGIGGCYEDWFFEGLPKMADDLESSILMVNYRGVGRSLGAVLAPKDLMSDGYAIAAFAHQVLKKEDQKIHLYGASMGGAVATHTGALLESEGRAPSTVCVDRSYGSLIDTIGRAIPIPYVKAVFQALMGYAGWGIDSSAAAGSIKEAQLIAIRSKEDRVIPPEASLATALEDKTDGKGDFVLIDLEPSSPTMGDILDHPKCPYWVIYELEKTYYGQALLAYYGARRIVKSFFNGVVAHTNSLDREHYPGGVRAYRALLDRAEARGRGLKKEGAT